ncbi:MAG TPA: thiamine phosphate synthase [Dehalococcoidia bacterium]|nr:thiamine phosphate synthase [Dehalococcoidia bacterium]
MSHQPLRMIDANLNRSSEGLRVLEDVARFLLNDAELSQRLRTLRHDLARETESLSVRLLSQRDSEHDVGSPYRIPLREKEINMKTTSLQGLLDLVTANAKRVEESLRVVEELAKLPEISPVLNSASFEQARFALYNLERDLISRISRRDKIERIAGLYVILDRQFLVGRDELDIARQIIEGGARVIQLRDKQSKRGELLLVAQKLRELCSQSDVLFIINDYLDLAIVVDADGLHIGQEDLPLPVVRRELPIDKIVGCSVTTLSQATKAQAEGADYIAVGSIFPTTTKREATVVGVDILKELKRTVSTSLVAIGGINQNNVDEVVAAGADAVAVISAVLGEKDVKGAVQKLVVKMDLAKGQCQNQ